jgi:hypothetical protein
MSQIVRSFPDTGAQLGGIKKNLIYKLVRAGDLELVKLGRRSFITDESIKQLVERQRNKRPV